MKVLIVVHYFYPHIGGMEEVALKQASSLTKGGHEVSVLTCRFNKDSPLAESFKGFSIQRIKALNFIENIFGVTFPLISPSSILKFIRNVRNADIIHIHDVFYLSSHFTALVAAIMKKKFFVTQHVAIVDHTSFMVVAIQKLVYLSIGRFIFNRAEKIVCYNTNVLDFLIKLGIDTNKIFLTRNGIDTDFFKTVTLEEKNYLKKKYNIDEHKPVVLFVGRLVPKKGFDLVYEAQSERYTTIIVGPGSTSLSVSQTKDVIFFGPADKNQLKELYSLSDIFVFPAIGEVFTLVMQEAMACGLPVITTNDPAYTRSKSDLTGILLIERDSKSLSKAISSVLNNEEVISDMSKHSRLLAEKDFSWESNYPNEEKIYSEILN